MTLSEWKEPSVLDITEAPDASVIQSRGLIGSADLSIGSPPVICLGFEEMGKCILLKESVEIMSFLCSILF